MSYLDLIFGLFVIAFLAFARIFRGQNNQGFGKDTTASIRGIAMIGIILHHIHSRFQGQSPILAATGFLGTGIFFFISGYGNMLSINRREDSVKIDWFLKKLVKLYIPFFVAYWIYFCVLELFYKDLVPSVKEILIDLVTASLPNKDSWFIKIILLCFLVHWIAKNLFSDCFKQNLFIFVVIAIYVIVMWRMHVKTQWYTSPICYPIGCIVAKPKLLNKILTYLKEKKVFSFVIFLLAFFAAMVLTRKIWAVTLVCPVLLSLACYYFSFIFEVKTRFLSWIGNNSFEFYILHYACLQGFYNLYDINKLYYTIGVLLSACALVYIYLFVKGRIMSLSGKNIRKAG